MQPGNSFGKVVSQDLKSHALVIVKTILSLSFGIRKVEIQNLTPLFIIILFVGGCGTSVSYKEVPAAALEREKGAIGLIEDVLIEAPSTKLKVGEKFIYQASWMGIPVGTGTLQVKELTELDGHQVYHVVAAVRSNAFLSAFFKVEDEIHSYIDKDGIFSWQSKRKLREGRYRADEAMEFDQINHTATYRSFRSGSVKTIDIPERVQDEISCLYYFRTQDVEVGRSVNVYVNADEKNWKVEVKILEKGTLKIRGLGTYQVFKTEPHATFRLKDTPLRKGRMWIWFSADEDRIPLVVKVKAPIVGSVTAVLEQMQ